MQPTSSADPARPGAVPGRIIGGRELPTSPQTTDSDGSPGAAALQLASPAAAARPGAVPGSIIGGRELSTSPLTTDSDGPPGAAIWKVGICYITYILC